MPSRYENQIRRVYETVLEGTYADDFPRAFAELTAVLASSQSIPSRGETAVVSVTKPRTAALAYDRVWGMTRVQDVPPPIAFHGTSPTEAKLLAAAEMFHLSLEFLKRGDRDFFGLQVTDIRDRAHRLIHRVAGIAPSQDAGYLFNRAIASALTAEYGLNVIPVYDSREAATSEYQLGDHAVLIPIISNLEIADESKLEWDQVLQFRQDADARRMYRRLVHWLDKEMVGRTQAFIEDEIAARLDDYREAMRRHGIRTALGSIASILDGKFVAGTGALAGSLAFLLSPVVGAAAGVGLVLGRVAVSIAQAELDAQSVRADYQDIAFVQEVSETFG